MDVLEKLDSRLVEVQQIGDQRSAICPAHEDNKPSLRYGPGEHGGVVMYCHAGCQLDQILAAVGLSIQDLQVKPHIVEEYPYTTEDGELLWTVERWHPKDFRVRPGLPPPAQRVLYAAPWVKYARQNYLPVYVVEGEKDANTLLRMGIPATTNVGGAGRGKWLAQYSLVLRGCDVVVVADNDEPGKRHARAIQEALSGIARSIRLVVPKHGKDLSDHLAAGHSLDELVPLPELEIGAVVISPADVQIKPVDWMWPGYIPRKAMSIIDGDPGDGKSVMTLDLAARWSTGAPLPDGTRYPGGPVDVVLLCAEDDEMVIAARLRAAGADEKKIHLVTSVCVDGDENRLFDLSTDIGHLEDVMQRHKAKVVVLDPLMAFLPEHIDVYKDHHVRRQLVPYLHLMQEMDAALIVVRHLTKGGSKAIYRGGGSIAFIGAARSGFLVTREQQDPEVRVLVNVKSNLGARPAALRYRLQPSPAYDAPMVEWLGTTDASAQQLLDADPREASALIESMVFLTGYLDEAGPSSWPSIVKAARDAGMGSEHTLRRARERLGLINKRTGYGDKSRVTWELPHDWQNDGLADPTTPTTPDKPDQSDSSTEGNVPPSNGTLPSSVVGAKLSRAHLPGILSFHDQQTSVIEAPPCDVCSSTERVGHWDAIPSMDIEECWRCPSHNPMTYAGGTVQPNPDSAGSDLFVSPSTESDIDPEELGDNLEDESGELS